MLALGCLIPPTAFVIGAGLDAYLGGTEGGYWGAGLGFGGGVLVAVVAVVMLDRAVTRK